MFVIDTNVASELMRPEPMPAVATWISKRDAEEIYLTAVSEAELLYGIAIMPAGRRRNTLEATMNRWLGPRLQRTDSTVRQRRRPSLRGDRGRPLPRGSADRRGGLPDRGHMPLPDFQLAQSDR